MCTLPSLKATQKIQRDEQSGTNSPSARGGPQPCSSSLTIQAYCDASFATGGGRSQSGILVLLVDEATNRASLLLWQPRRQTLTALSAPEAEAVALSEALMPAVVIHESCCAIGLEVGQSPKILFVVKTGSQVTLTQLRNESITTRSRPFANNFSYARDMCHGTSVHPASVKAVFEPGKAKRLMASQKYLLLLPGKHLSDLGLAPLPR